MRVEKNPAANEIFLLLETGEDRLALDDLITELAVANLDVHFAVDAPGGRGAAAVTVALLKPEAPRWPCIPGHWAHLGDETRVYLIRATAPTGGEAWTLPLECEYLGSDGIWASVRTLPEGGWRLLRPRQPPDRADFGAPGPAQAPPRDEAVEQNERLPQEWADHIRALRQENAQRKRENEKLRAELTRFHEHSGTKCDGYEQPCLPSNEPTTGKRITLQEAGARAEQDLAAGEEMLAEYAEQEARGGAVWEESDSPASDPVSECREAITILVLRALGPHDDVRDSLLDTRPTATQARFTGDAAYDMARAAALLATDMARAAAGADLSDSVRARAQDYLLPMLRNSLAACIAYLREFTGPGPTPEGVRALFPEAKT